MTSDKGQKLFLCLTAISIILIVYFSRLWLLQTRAFDNDEFEHMHAAWLISQGFLPFKDFFEHHTPAMHFLLAQFFPLFNVETDFEDATNMLMLSRRIMWVLSGCILLLTFKIGQFWKNWKVGLVGTVFLVCTLMFQEKTLEIRPDLLSIPCWLGCLYFLIRAVQLNSVNSRNWMMFASGFLLGTSIMATQKMLFAMPGFTLAMFIYWFNPNSNGTIWERFVQILFQLAGFFTPLIITLGYFGMHGAAFAFIEYNLLLNLGWKVGFSPYHYTLQLLSQNPFLVGFGLLGLIWSIRITWWKLKLKGGDYLLDINLIGLLFGLFIIPVPWRQYYLIFLPLLSLYAGFFTIELVQYLVKVRSKFTNSCLIVNYGLFVILIAVLMLFTFAAVPDVGISDVVKKSVLFIVIIGGLIPIFLKKTDLAIAYLIVALHLPTAKKFLSKFNSSNAEQLTSIQFVIENSSPDDTFMDGWKGIGLFRQHAYFYWMLHEEIRGMLSDEQKVQLLSDLQSGKINPLLVNLDEDLIELSPEITAFFLKNYRPVGVADIHERIEH